MYDLTRLTALGKKRKKLIDELAALDEELKPEIRAAHVAGVEQKKIIDLTGYARESVRLASMTPEEREQERQKRRKPSS